MRFTKEDINCCVFFVSWLNVAVFCLRKQRIRQRILMWAETVSLFLLQCIVESLQSFMPLKYLTFFRLNGQLENLRWLRTPCTYIYFLTLPKVSSYSDYLKSIKRKGCPSSFEYLQLKLKLRVLFTSHTGAMVTYCVIIIIITAKHKRSTNWGDCKSIK